MRKYRELSSKEKLERSKDNFAQLSDAMKKLTEKDFNEALKELSNNGKDNKPTTVG